MEVLKICILSLLYVHYSSCYDVELQGKMHLSDAFVNKISSGSAKPEELRNSLVKEVESVILNSRRSPLESMNIKIPYDLANVFRHAILSRRSSDGGPTAQGELISKYIVHLKEKAAKRIKVLCKQLKKLFHMTVVIPLRIKSIISKYSARMKSYLQVILNENFDSELEKEFILMDIVETSNKILYNEAKIILNEFVDENYASLDEDDIKRATEIIYRKSVESKKEDYKYLCNTISLCRPFPAYSDYLAELFSELLKSSGDKFRKLLKVTLNLLKHKHGFFEQAIGVNATKHISVKIQKHVDKDWMTARDSLAILRGIITHRHEWIRNDDDAVVNKTKAIRISLDIIDRAFSDEGEVVVASQIDLTVKAFRDWATDLRDDLERILYTFLTFSAGILNKNLPSVAKEELKSLTEIICVGTSHNKELQSELFSTGSRYILQNKISL